MLHIIHSGACYQSVPFYIAINIAIIFAKIAIIITFEMVEKKQNPGFGYCELEGRKTFRCSWKHENVIAHLQMSYDEENDYPLMSIKNIQKM